MIAAPPMLTIQQAVFISDLHLTEALPKTTAAFFTFINWVEKQRLPALFILGDLFEYWAGDDDLDAPYHQSICRALKQLSSTGTTLYLMRGNRDVLFGEAFAQACSATLLDDPTLIQLETETVLLAHGDAYCTDDMSYQAFRQQVRNPAWQSQFLQMPLAQRKHIIANIRSESEQAKQGKSMAIMDVNPQAIIETMQTNAVQTLIHGHTHRPARHTLEVNQQAAQRFVIPDWELDSDHPHAGYLAYADQQYHLHLQLP